MREAELLITCATLLGCVLIAVWRARPRVQWWGLVLGLGAMPLVVGMWLSRQHDRRRAQALAVHEPRDRSARLGSAWASAKRCQACHAGAHATWQATYHRRMTQRATADAVLARWEGEVVDQGRRYRFIQRDGRYYVDMPRYGTNGESAERRMLRPVVLTTGSHHQQLYWISLPWADDRPYEEADVLYQTRCASCHGAEGWQGEAKQLRKAGLFASAVDTVLRSEGHQALLPSGPLDDADRTKLVDFVLRLQSEDRLMQFPLAWLVEEQRWVNEEHTFLHPEPEPDRVETFQERWSNNCDQCHAVGATFDEPTLGRLGRSEVADLGIACEACHGQGAVHADRHESPLARYETHVAGAAEDDIVNPRDLPPAESAAVCGQCHAETWPLDAPTPAFRPGERLEDHERVVQFVEGPRPKWLTDAVAIDSELLDSGFWRDGTMRIAGRDYNGLTISPCHETGGLTCIDCHQLHGSDPNDQLAAAARDGRTLCGRCHEAIAADVAAHSHHPAGSTGSDCYNCHMPRTTYGLLTVIRAHRIDSPSVWQSQRGRPNACNL
ncbi:MAG: hypothetical protein KC731_37440, partial [Myxococcales bacterium]|nr:hypothetical protein [Myxococcales bacterium]